MRKQDNFRPRRNAVPDRNYMVTGDAKLLDFLLSLWKDCSRTTVKSYLAHRQIAVNGRTETAFDLQLHAGDTVTLRAVGEQKQNPNHKVKIVYEDDDIIVVDKKPGVLSMSTGKEGEQTAYSVLMEHVRRYNRNSRVYIVHRLDRDTSGLLLFAKSPEMQEMLQRYWNENVLERTYVAVVEGKPDPENGRIVSWLTENPKSLKITASSVDNGGKKAITDYKLLKCNGNYSLLEVSLETGRKNQIRVQLAYIGNPVAGDKRYGAKTNPLGRLCLHARVLEFVHPATGERMRFDTDIPAIFR